MDENLFEEELTIEALGIHTVDEIPDEKTVWHVKNILSKAGTFDALFDKFRSYLDSKGLSFNEGKIIDASFVEAPRQRNTVFKMVGKELSTSGGRTYRRYELSDGRKEKK